MYRTYTITTIAHLCWLNMRLVVEILTGKLFYVQVGDTATVLDLKKKIGAQEKLPDDRLILLLLNTLMNENEASLVEYGVQDGSHIYLFFDNLRDGLTRQFLSSTSELN
ncbi:Ubiquitin [Artemisia annua]|uniref:Ubiquitin n=1 Tax=Artemisia annua TaxID=35608 RepID=A0A2U1KZS9_ARTAN|nr:Ubiquitin [Artemisia annua]